MTSTDGTNTGVPASPNGEEPGRDELTQRMLATMPKSIRDMMPPEALAEFAAQLQPALKDVDPSQQMNIVQRSASLALQFSTPIPPGFVLEGINQAVPTGAERIVKMVERDQAHSHAMDRRTIRYPFVYQLTGLLGGTSVALSAIGGAVYCITHGQPGAGVAIFATTVATVVGILVKGAWSGRAPDAKTSNPPKSPQKQKRRR